MLLTPNTKYHCTPACDITLRVVLEDFHSAGDRENGGIYLHLPTESKWASAQQERERAAGGQVHGLGGTGWLPREVGCMKIDQGHPVLRHLCPALRTGAKNALLAHSYPQCPSQEIFRMESAKLSLALGSWTGLSAGPWSQGRYQDSLPSHVDFSPSCLLLGSAAVMLGQMMCLER